MGFDPIQLIADWLEKVLLGWGTSEMLTEVLLQLLGAIVVAGIVMVIFIFLTWLERKGAARFQDRIGPNRVGPYGLIQPIADALKMVTKEDTTPEGADKFSFNLAPILAVFSVLMIWAVIPFTETWFGTDLSVGVLYIAAVGSFSILSVLLAGWSSNNKYALLGGFRGVAQLISYEVPLLMSLLVPVFLTRSMGLNKIVAAQTSDGGVWYILVVPLAALIYFVSALAEVGRAPFDLIEADSEIVAGYFIEYSGMKFGLFQAGEFLHSFTFAALMSTLFFGGWHGPGAEKYMLLGLVYFFGKTFFFYMVIIWSRLTFPRVRIDQLMNLNWKFMIPLSLVLMMGIPVIDFAVKDMPGWVRIVSLLAFNIILGVSALTYAGRSSGKEEKERVRFEGRPVAVMPQMPQTEEETAA